jgi:hypothetical protein
VVASTVASVWPPTLSMAPAQRSDASDGSQFAVLYLFHKRSERKALAFALGKVFSSYLALDDQEPSKRSKLAASLSGMGSARIACSARVWQISSIISPSNFVTLPCSSASCAPFATKD